MKEITFDELLAQFDPTVHPDLQRVARQPGTTHLVVFENRLMDSSARGERTAVVVGPERTFRTLQDAYGTWLNDQPSQRQYPVAHASVPT